MKKTSSFLSLVTISSLLFFTSCKKSELFDCDKKEEYKEVIVEPLVTIDGCDYIVSGIIDYYAQDGTYLSRVNYGDGTCDEWATKTWPAGGKGFKKYDAGTKTYSLKDTKK